jgi:thiol-disulfide isomerase/thioredoxin
MDLTAALALLAVALSLAALIVALGATVRVDRFVGAGVPPRMGLHVGTEIGNDTLGPVLPDATRAAWLEGPSIILFASSSCEPCRELVRKVGERGRRAHQPRIVVVELAATDADSGIGNSIDFEAIVVRDMDGRLQQAFQVAGTPHTFLIAGSRVKRQAVGLDGLALFEELDVTDRTLAAAEA